MSAYASRLSSNRGSVFAGVERIWCRAEIGACLLHRLSGTPRARARNTTTAKANVVQSRWPPMTPSKLESNQSHRGA